MRFAPLLLAVLVAHARADTVTIPATLSETIDQPQHSGALPGVGYPGLVEAWGFQLPSDLPTVYGADLMMPLGTTILSPKDNGVITVGFYGVDFEVQVAPLSQRFGAIYIGTGYEEAPGSLALQFGSIAMPLSGAPTTMLDIPLDAQAIFQIEGTAVGDGGILPQTGVFELQAHTGAFSTLFTNPPAPPQLVLTVPEPGMLSLAVLGGLALLACRWRLGDVCGEGMHA